MIDLIPREYFGGQLGSYLYSNSVLRSYDEKRVAGACQLVRGGTRHGMKVWVVLNQTWMPKERFLMKGYMTNLKSLCITLNYDVLMNGYTGSDRIDSSHIENLSKYATPCGRKDIIIINWRMNIRDWEISCNSKVSKSSTASCIVSLPERSWGNLAMGVTGLALNLNLVMSFDVTRPSSTFSRRAGWPPTLNAYRVVMKASRCSSYILGRTKRLRWAVLVLRLLKMLLV